jgi:hypothetical protein
MTDITKQELEIMKKQLAQMQAAEAERTRARQEARSRTRSVPRDASASKPNAAKPWNAMVATYPASTTSASTASSTLQRHQERQILP